MFGTASVFHHGGFPQNVGGAPSPSPYNQQHANPMGMAVIMQPQQQQQQGVAYGLLGGWPAGGAQPVGAGGGAQVHQPPQVQLGMGYNALQAAAQQHQQPVPVVHSHAHFGMQQHAYNHGYNTCSSQIAQAPAAPAPAHNATQPTFFTAGHLQEQHQQQQLVPAQNHQLYQMNTIPNTYVDSHTRNAQNQSSFTPQQQHAQWQPGAFVCGPQHGAGYPTRQEYQAAGAVGATSQQSHQLSAHPPVGAAVASAENSGGGAQPMAVDAGGVSVSQDAWDAAASAAAPPPVSPPAPAPPEHQKQAKYDACSASASAPSTAASSAASPETKQRLIVIPENYSYNSPPDGVAIATSASTSSCTARTTTTATAHGRPSSPPIDSPGCAEIRLLSSLPQVSAGGEQVVEESQQAGEAAESTTRVCWPPTTAESPAVVNLNVNLKLNHVRAPPPPPDAPCSGAPSCPNPPPLTQKVGGSRPSSSSYPKSHSKAAAMKSTCSSWTRPTTMSTTTTACSSVSTSSTLGSSLQHVPKAKSASPSCFGAENQERQSAAPAPFLPPKARPSQRTNTKGARGVEGEVGSATTSMRKDKDHDEKQNRTADKNAPPSTTRTSTRPRQERDEKERVHAPLQEQHKTTSRKRQRDDRDDGYNINHEDEQTSDQLEANRSKSYRRINSHSSHSTAPPGPRPVPPTTSTSASAGRSASASSSWSTSSAAASTGPACGASSGFRAKRVCVVQRDREPLIRRATVTELLEFPGLPKPADGGEIELEECSC